MTDEIKQQLDRIERNGLLSAKNVLNMEDVSLLTGLSKSFIYKMTYTMQIPHYKPNGKHVYFDRKEVEGWMRQNRVATQGEVQGIAHTYMATGKMREIEK